MLETPRWGVYPFIGICVFFHTIFYVVVECSTVQYFGRYDLDLSHLSLRDSSQLVRGKSWNRKKVGAASTDLRCVTSDIFFFENQIFKRNIVAPRRPVPAVPTFFLFQLFSRTSQVESQLVLPFVIGVLPVQLMHVHITYVNRPQ